MRRGFVLPSFDFSLHLVGNSDLELNFLYMIDKSLNIRAPLKTALAIES